MESLPNFCLDLSDAANFVDTGALTCGGTSTDSSPSPVMINSMRYLRGCKVLTLVLQIFSNMENMNYDAFPGSPTNYSLLDSHSNSPIVEFTDLTIPYHEDRRRRRSHVIRDKQTLSTMHMVSDMDRKWTATDADSVDALKIELHNAHSESEKKSMPKIYNISWMNWNQSTKPS